MKLIHKSTGKEVQVGDIVKFSRDNDETTVEGIERPRHSGSTGRIYTPQGGYFPSVFDCEWIEREDRT